MTITCKSYIVHLKHFIVVCAYVYHALSVLCSNVTNAGKQLMHKIHHNIYKHHLKQETAWNREPFGIIINIKLS